MLVPQPAVHLSSGSKLRTLEEKFLNFMKPKPIPMTLVRVGGKSDGAYLVPQDLEGIETCFSPGVSTYKTFEDELTNQYKIKCHMVDFSSRIEDLESPMIEGLQTFFPLWLRGETTSDSISLSDWIDLTEPAATGDFLLQMDIEGGEYEVLLSSPPEVLGRFRILVIEFHGVRSDLESRGEGAVIFRVIEKLSPSFVVAHVHPNNCCGLKRLPGGRALIPEVMEVTFLRRDRLAEVPTVGSIRSPRIPHQLDIGPNDPLRPPVFLNTSWTSPGGWFLSLPMKIRDNFRFFFSLNFWIYIAGKVKRVWRNKVRRPLKGLVDSLYRRLVLEKQRRKHS
jgi:hypothetical protein